MRLPVVALTMGDPAGVGPEICLRAVAPPGSSRRNENEISESPLHQVCHPVIFGDASVLTRCAAELRLPAPTRIARDPRVLAQTNAEPPQVIDLGLLDAAQLKPGVVSAETGRASFGYIQAAIDAALRGNVAAVATAPINKEAIHAAGINFPGHTEMFAARCESARWCMMQYSPEITCTFVTVHVGYAEVPHLLTTERILDVIQLSADGLRQLRDREPKIVVCGLNPHAGEHGLFGDREEERIIIPAIEAARRQGLQVEGPLPPDTAFLPWKRKETDVFVCMYHDQGHIPVKALAFDSAVNTTLGLPIVRTSVDHGTACDIAWQGKARPDSLFAALRLAAKLAPLRAAAAQES